MTVRRLVGGSIVLLAANVIGGLGHYYFQLRGAARLDAAAYGALNAWMAYLSIALAPGALAQIAANFRPRLGAELRRAVLGALALCAVLALAIGAALTVLRPEGLLFPAALAGGIALSYLLGQLQAHTRFAGMGLVLLTVSAVKVAATFVPLGTRPGVAYYAAFAISFAAGCAAAALLLLAASAGEAHAQTPGEGRIGSTVVLALATALAPQLDLLNLRSAHGDAVLGEFARASLFAKALYFGALTLLQVTLPFHVRMARGTAAPGMARRVRAIERLGLAGCVAASISLAWIAPPLSRVLVGIELTGEQRWWVVLSCLCLTTLWAHLQRIQLFCALGRWKPAALRLVPLVATLPVFALLRPRSVTLYLGVALAWYAAAHLVFLVREA